MIWFRMCQVALRLIWPHVLTPWRSPLVRWRLETYGCCGAAGHPKSARDITARDVLRFVLTRRHSLVSFLRWAASLSR